MNKKMMNMLGIGAAILGIGATLFSGWVSEKKTDSIIEEKVTKAIADLLKKES